MRFTDLRTTGALAVVRRELRPLFMKMRRFYFNKLWGMDIGPDCMISFSAKLDTSYPGGVHIGESSAVSFRASILSHDYTRRLHLHTYIGKECQIGAHSIIMPGVRIGDNCVVLSCATKVASRIRISTSGIFICPSRRILYRILKPS